MDSFIWTDQLVREYYDWKSVSKEPHFNHIEIFKQSKTIPNKEYEILSYISSNGDILNPLYFPEYSGNFFSNCKIHSVRRLSDNEVLTIGDKVEGGIIKGFEIFTGALQIGIENTETRGYLKPLHQIKKVEDKEPILTDIEKINKRLDDMELKFKLWLHSVI